MAGSASAHELTIGSRATPTVDPRSLFLTGTVAYNSPIYGLLVARDENARRVPDLATSWQAVDDATWEFELRGRIVVRSGRSRVADDPKSMRYRKFPMGGNPGNLSSVTSAHPPAEPGCAPGLIHDLPPGAR